MDTSLQEPTLPSSNGESRNATATLSLNSSQFLCYALCTLTIGVALITIPPPPFFPDSSASSQSKRKGKHRQTACSTAVPSKCSAQRDEKMDYEAVAENSADSTASNHSAVKVSSTFIFKN